jgi:L-ribulose-5-phosphate 4-epimerase
MDAKKFKQLREEVWQANVQLLKAGLVTMHSGNVSGLDRDAGLVLIKPSGVDYEKLQPEDLAIVTMEGHAPLQARVPDRVLSNFKPSVDTPHHLVLYKKDPALGGIAHTHSNFATAFAVLGLPIPCCLTAMADEFGGEIPCAPYIDNEGENIASAILKYRGRGPAILLGNHGVFTFAETPAKAIKAAVMLEDIAKTIFLAKQMGEPTALPPAEIEKWWHRYHTSYGQQK